jgi:hypothetical protein
MSQGLEHVEETLALIESVSDKVGKLDGVEEGWRSEAVAQLAATAGLLGAVTDRFFLKTRVCLPFTKRCEDAAKALDVLLAEAPAQLASDDQPRVDAALDRLERVAKTLDERSQMRGMAIT